MQFITGTVKKTQTQRLPVPYNVLTPELYRKAAAFHEQNKNKKPVPVYKVVLHHPVKRLNSKHLIRIETEGQGETNWNFR